MNELGSLLSSMLANLPGVVVTSKLNSTNFTVARKVFAFTKGDAVVMKLPPPVIARLVAGGTATRLIMGKRMMKEWVVLRRPTPTDFKNDLRRFKEAVAFVASGAGRQTASGKQTNSPASHGGLAKKCSAKCRNAEMPDVIMVQPGKVPARTTAKISTKAAITSRSIK